MKIFHDQNSFHEIFSCTFIENSMHQLRVKNKILGFQHGILGHVLLVHENTMKFNFMVLSLSLQCKLEIQR